MNEVQALTEAVLKDPKAIMSLKVAETDEEFIDSLIEFGRSVGFSVSEEEIVNQMKADRELARSMTDDEFESVAGTMLGARMSGGHQSGASC